jgi:ABC-type nitrate/sulfonate/bicarbonate transport system substrate-binding protein
VAKKVLKIAQTFYSNVCVSPDEEEPEEEYGMVPYYYYCLTIFSSFSPFPFSRKLVTENAPNYLVFVTMTVKNLLLFLFIMTIDSLLRGAVAQENCKSTEPLMDMSFQLDWRFNAQFAGIFMADHSGGLADAGVNLTVRQWDDGINAIEEVAQGRADFACAEQNLIIAAQAAGAPVKAVATMFQFSPYGLMAPPEDLHFMNLDSLEALIDNDIGVHVDGLKVMDLVKGVNNLTDINVTEIPYGGKWNRTANGELAAVQCYVIDEPIGVESNYGVRPTVLRLSEYGFISTAQTIVVSDETLATKGELVTRVLGAIFQGWVDTLADKPAAAQIVVDEYVPEGSVYKDVSYQTETLELLEPYVIVEGRDMGVIDADIWKEAAQLMLDYGIVDSLPDDLDSTLATEYYTGPIEFQDCSPSGGFKVWIQASLFVVFVGMVISIL